MDFFQYRGLNTTSGLYKVLFASAQTINKSSTEFAFVYENGENNVTVFPGKLINQQTQSVAKICLYIILYTGGIPSDGLAIPQIFTFHLALVIPYYILATAGLVFCTVCLVFNFTQRNKK